jgi:hypothetical protein
MLPCSLSLRLFVLCVHHHDNGRPQNLAAEGRVACDLLVSVLVLSKNSFPFFRTPAGWMQLCGLFFSFYADWRTSEGCSVLYSGMLPVDGRERRGQARHAAACPRLVRIKTSMRWF